MKQFLSRDIMINNFFQLTPNKSVSEVWKAYEFICRKYVYQISKAASRKWPLGKEQGEEGLQRQLQGHQASLADNGACYASLVTWVQVLESMERWKGRTNSTKLSIDFHTHVMVCAPTPILLPLTYKQSWTIQPLCLVVTGLLLDHVFFLSMPVTICGFLQ